MGYADNYVTVMTRVAVEVTGVDAETTGLATETTGVAVDAQVATEIVEVMDIDMDTVDTASVKSSPDTKPEDIEELECTDKLESLELASELDAAVTQELTIHLMTWTLDIWPGQGNLICNHEKRSPLTELQGKLHDFLG